MDEIKILAALKLLHQNDERMEGAIAELAHLLRETRETSIQKFAEIKAETKAVAKLEPRIDALENYLNVELSHVKKRLEAVRRDTEFATKWIEEKECSRRDDIRAVRQYVLLAVIGAFLTLGISGALTWIATYDDESVELTK